MDSGTFGRAITNELPEIIEEISPQVFIIAGDISARPTDIEDVMLRFSSIDCPKLFVPGNHDIWVSARSTELSSTKYEQVLPEICASTGFHFLPKRPIEIQGVGFAGTIGWYDYSFRNKTLDGAINSRMYQRKIYGGRMWNDARYARWGKTDAQVTAELAQQFDDDLNELETDGIPIVAVMHHLPFEELVVKSGRFEQDFFLAYMGSSIFGKILSSKKNLHTVICGHTHRARDTEIEGIHVVASPLGYGRERGNIEEFDPADAVGVIEVE